VSWRDNIEDSGFATMPGFFSDQDLDRLLEEIHGKNATVPASDAC